MFPTLAQPEYADGHNQSMQQKAPLGLVLFVAVVAPLANNRKEAHDRQASNGKAAILTMKSG
ncbi:MAG: hypothetical protein NVSMB38_46110 [Ktedonobacteraceae bacterium]